MFQGTGVPLLSQEGNTRFPYLLQVLLPRFDPGVRIALACTLDLQVVFVEFNNASSLQAGVPHHLFELPPRIRGGSSNKWCGDRKSTRLNSSHQIISYAVFCLKKKTKKIETQVS